MQDCYAGDIGNHGKFALLHELHKQGLSIGINWYKTDAIVSEKQNDGKYCIPDRLAAYDTDLSSRLKKIFHSQDGIARSIEALEAEQLISRALYYSETVPSEHRDEWHQHALCELDHRADRQRLRRGRAALHAGRYDGSPPQARGTGAPLRDARSADPVTLGNPNKFIKTEGSPRWAPSVFAPRNPSKRPPQERLSRGPVAEANAWQPSAGAPFQGQVAEADL